MMELRAEEYNAEKIKVLSGLEPVRKRPGMYIGSTGPSGLHNLIFELVDNSIDEALAGWCKNIEVILHSDGSATVRDDGRGIPTEIHPTEGRSALEVVMTTLHSGGKFDHRTYKVATGLHGVGLSVVNALSEWLEVEVRRGGKVYGQRYERGKPVTAVSVIGETKRSGTEIRFMPDPEIFEETEFNFDILVNRLREQAFLNKGVRIVLRDERSEKPRERVFQYDGGIVSFVEYLSRGKELLHPTPIFITGSRDGTKVEVAIQYTDGYSEMILSFANNKNTEEGGTHVTGFRSALTRVINDYARSLGLSKQDQSLLGEDIREGLIAVVSVMLPDPQFEGQTKAKLGNSEVKGIVEMIVADGLISYFEENPSVVRRIVEKALIAARAREAAKKQRELARKKSIIEMEALPSKLADCVERDPKKAELFIVEGESAGGIAKQGRNRNFQAILPLRGKVINVEKNRFEKVLSNEEIKAIISAIGTGVGKDFDIKKLRYNKIIIMTDADVDGAHIRVLLLTFFYRYMPQLIGEHIYIAQPPLYRVKKGKKEIYISNDRELEVFLIREGAAGIRVIEEGSGVEIEGGKLREFLLSLGEFERIVERMEEKGISISDYMELRKRGVVYRIRAGLREYYFLDVEEARRKFEEEMEQVRAVGVDSDQPNLIDEMRVESEELEPQEIPEIRELEALISRMSRIGVDMRGFLEGRRTASFTVIEDGRRHRVEGAEELLELVKRIGARGTTIQRYKGLAEMNAEQLWETTMDPERRTLLKVRIEDAIEADRIFTILMGTRVEPRRAFIQAYAPEVRNLDI
jgi:DNA gyrase subunit B